MPNHKDFWAGLSIRAVPVRFTYGGSREISTMEGQMKYMLLIYNEEKAWGKFSEAQRQGFLGEFTKFTQQIHSAGQWLASSHLQPTSAAPRLPLPAGNRPATDGPFPETPPHPAGTSP